MKKILILLCFIINVLALDLEIFNKYETEYGNKQDAIWNFMHDCKYKTQITNGCDKKDEFVKYFKDECEKGNGKFCSAIGHIYNDELITSDDKTKDSINYYKKACDLNIPISCAIIGLKYYNMFSVSTNEKEKQILLKNTKEYYKKACDLGLEMSCKDLKRLTQEQKQEKNSKYYYIALFIIVILLIRMFFKNKSKNM